MNTRASSMSRARATSVLLTSLVVMGAPALGGEDDPAVVVQLIASTHVQGAYKPCT